MSTRTLMIFRPVNLLMIAIIQYVIQYHIIRQYASAHMAIFTDIQFILFVLITVIVAAAGYLVNDIYDLEIDTVNKPGRNLAAFGLNPTMAWSIYGILVAGGLALTISLGPPYRIPGVLLYTGSVLMLWLYSARLKKLPVAGNVLVSAFSALVVLVPWLAQGLNGVPDDTLTVYARSTIWMYTLFAGLSTLIREIVKDLEDTEGDSLHGARTLPIIAGKRSAVNICIFLDLFLLGILGLWIYSTQNSANSRAVWMLILTVMTPLLILIPLLLRATDKDQFHFISQYIKAVMLFAVIYLLLV